MTHVELEEKLRQLGLLEHQLRDAMPLIDSYLKEEVERAKAKLQDKVAEWSEDVYYCTYEEEESSRFRPICKWCGETEFSSAHDVARLLNYIRLTPPAQQEKHHG